MEAQVHSPEHKRKPSRTCAGCRSAAGKGELVRVVLAEDGLLVVDLGGSAFGRGAWLHPRWECIERAAPRGLSKSFKGEVKTGPQELALSIARAGDRRVSGLLASAKSAKRLAAGRAVVVQEIEAERAQLIVVASDARAAAESNAVQRMIAAGRAACWGTKQTLGGAVGRGETGIIAVLDRGIAQALESAIALSHIADSIAGFTAGRQDLPEEG
jgi:predicted RNA-binding protein YlxR (DUF448 family)/ribosomal protein L7Ae-like RNA K-turn-binding protein